MSITAEGLRLAKTTGISTDLEEEGGAQLGKIPLARFGGHIVTRICVTHNLGTEDAGSRRAEKSRIKLGRTEVPGFSPDNGGTKPGRGISEKW